MSSDDIIIVPDMLPRDIQLYYPSLRMYHCGIWYLVTILVDDLPYYIKNIKKKKTNFGLNYDDVINLQTSLKIYNQLYCTSAMACYSKTWYCLNSFILNIILTIHLLIIHRENTA